MINDPHESPDALRPHEVRLDRLIGRQVRAGNGRPVGRLEECRTEMRGSACVITEYVIGAAGLFERLGVGAKRIVGLAPAGHVARWDQIDLTDPQRPRLTCSVDDLRPL